jgi:hypothetical protein
MGLKFPCRHLPMSDNCSCVTNNKSAQLNDDWKAKHIAKIRHCIQKPQMCCVDGIVRMHACVHTHDIMDV